MKCSGVFCLFLIAIVVGARNYCNISDCGARHIGCNNSGEFDLKCPEGTSVVDLKMYKDLILGLHNEERNAVAGGQTTLQPASRMVQMQWDDELAALALLTAKRCKVEKDECHPTEQFPNSGQNVGIHSYCSIGVEEGAENTANLTNALIESVKLGESMNRELMKGNTTKKYGDKIKENDDGTTIRNRLNCWVKEIENITMDYIKSFPGNVSFRSFDHFALIINDNVTHVGCGAVRFKNDTCGELLLVCNYALSNNDAAPVYKVSESVGSECEKGKSDTYPNLCTPNVGIPLESDNLGDYLAEMFWI